MAKRDKLMEECATNPTLENLSACLACGGAAASTLCKRAQLLLKAQRPRAAALDASAALALNPDSARAYKIRGRARRLAGDYEGAAADFGQAQRIDFDPDVRPDLVYCSTRSAKIRAIKLAEEKARKEAEEAPPPQKERRRNKKWCEASLGSPPRKAKKSPRVVEKREREREREAKRKERAAGMCASGCFSARGCILEQQNPQDDTHIHVPP